MTTDASTAAATTIHGPVPPEGGPLTGDPTSIGLPGFIAGSTAFGLAQAGVVPLDAAGAALPVILGFSAALIFLTTIWAAALGRNAVASVFGIFAAFWLSYGLLLIGLAHNWFGIAPGSAKGTRELYLIVWLVVIVTLTFATLRLPLIYTAVFGLVDLALLLSLLGVTTGSLWTSRAGGYAGLAFAALGVYLYASTASVATGGRPLPLGHPILR